jgi:hypothetical protein
VSSSHRLFVRESQQTRAEQVALSRFGRHPPLEYGAARAAKPKGVANLGQAAYLAVSSPNDRCVPTNRSSSENMLSTPGRLTVLLLRLGRPFLSKNQPVQCDLSVPGDCY